ncbi:hypothetical protein M0R19_07655 [Candidatus Pacearchaeota archaeon]|jgi:hypothetical protein|nr:hypothetical protein [bacterium]MCK9597034.1 hypothetical protein [Candidatus Pacearchaeota archaeon]
MKLKLNKSDANFIAECIRQELYSKRAYVLESNTVKRIVEMDDFSLINKYIRTIPKNIITEAMSPDVVLSVSFILWWIVGGVATLLGTLFGLKKGTEYVKKVNDIKKENNELKSQIAQMKSSKTMDISNIKSIISSTFKNLKSALSLKYQALKNLKPQEIKMPSVDFLKTSSLLSSVGSGILIFALSVGFVWLIKLGATMVKKIIEYMKNLHKADPKVATAFANRAKSASDSLRKKAEIAKIQDKKKTNSASKNNTKQKSAAVV